MSRIQVSKRGSWKYQRAVPTRHQALLGLRLWTKPLGRVSRAVAEDKARHLDNVFDAYLTRIDNMPEAERAQLVTDGGLKKLEDTLAHEETMAWLYGVIGRNEDLPTVESLRATLSVLTGGSMSPSTVTLATAKQLRGDVAASVLNARQQLDALKASNKRRRSTLNRLKPSGTDKMSVLLDTWERISAPRSPSTHKRMTLFLTRFVEVVGDLEPGAVTRKDAMVFRDWLAKQPTLTRSAEKHLHGMSRMFRVGVSEGLVEFNPFQGIAALKAPGWKLSGQKSRTRFEPEQARAILKALDKIDVSQPLWRDFRHVFRLMIYHGCRSGEIVNLAPSDVRMVGKIPVFDANDEQPTATIKNMSSMREVPLHPRCKELITYANAAAKAGQQYVFASFPMWSNGRAGKFQQMATKFLREDVGIASKKITAHSARHFWRYMAGEIDMPGSVSRAIVGHSLGKDDHDGTYGSLPSLNKRYSWLKKINPLKG